VLSLKSNNLRADGGKALAAGLKGNQVITELNIADNELTNYGKDMSGLIALVDVIPDMRALVKLDASNNMFGLADETGITAWATALKACTSITVLNLAKNNINMNDTKILASAIRDMRALSTLSFGGENFLKDGAWVTPVPATLEIGMTEANFSNKNLGVGGAIIIVAWISNKDNGALTLLNLAGNNIGGHEDEEGNYIATPEGIATFYYATPHIRVLFLLLIARC
jgi:hypothetical protein